MQERRQTNTTTTLVGMDLHSEKVQLCVTRWTHGADPVRERFLCTTVAALEATYRRQVPEGAVTVLEASTNAYLVEHQLVIGAAPVPKRLKYNFVGWYTQPGGFGERWFDENGTPLFSSYDVLGDTTLYPVWIRNGATDADYRLNATGIEVGDETVTIPVSAEKADYLDTSLEYVKVRASETLPVPANAPEVKAVIRTLDDGTKALVIPRDPDAKTMFYRIHVED